MGENGSLAGKHMLLTYENGWLYELYIKDDSVLDYRVHKSIVAGRWVKDQSITQRALGDGCFKLFWVEPTGTVVSIDIDLVRRKAHDAIFFPRWIEQYPERIICFQNDFLEQMTAYRDAGPTYPMYIVDAFAEITYLDDRGVGDETVIACAPASLPAGHADRAG